MLSRCQVYRPTKTSDGEGGFTETYSTATVLYGGITVHHNRTTFSFRSGEDLRPEDVVLVGAEYYRALAIVENPRGPRQVAEVERTERPTFG